MPSPDPYMRNAPVPLATIPEREHRIGRDVPTGQESDGREGLPFDRPTAELVKNAMAEARELIRLEVELAKDEMKHELMAARSAGIALGVGASLLLIGVTLVLVALGLSIFPGPTPALMIGIVVLAAAALAVVSGITLLPKKPLYETRFRIENAYHTVKESVKERAA